MHIVSRRGGILIIIVGAEKSAGCSEVRTASFNPSSLCGNKTIKAHSFVMWTKQDKFQCFVLAFLTINTGDNSVIAFATTTKAIEINEHTPSPKIKIIAFYLANYYSFRNSC